MFTYQGLSEAELKNKDAFAGKINLVAVPALALSSVSLLWPGRRVAKLMTAAITLAVIIRGQRVSAAYLRLTLSKTG